MRELLTEAMREVQTGAMRELQTGVQRGTEQGARDHSVRHGTAQKLKESVIGKQGTLIGAGAIVDMIAVTVQRKVMAHCSTRGPSAPRGLLQETPDSWAPGISLTLLLVMYQAGHLIFLQTISFLNLKSHQI